MEEDGTKNISSIFTTLKKKLEESIIELKEELFNSLTIFDCFVSEALNWSLAPQQILNDETYFMEFHSPFSDKVSENVENLQNQIRKLSQTTKVSKLNVFLSSFLVEYEDQIIKILEILTLDETFQECVVYTGLSELAHKFHPKFKSSTQSPFHYYQKLFSQRSNKKGNILVAIVHLPTLVYHYFTSGMSFIIPSCVDVFPFLEMEVDSATGRRPNIESLPENQQIPLLKLVHSLKSFLLTLNLKEDIYTLGNTSNLIGRELRNVSKNDPSPTLSSPTTVSFILVDRTFDLVPTIWHGGDNLFDKIMNTLPKNGYEYSSDSKVDLIEFCPQFNVIPTSPSDSIPMGHLVHPSDKNVSALIEIIATKREKDSLSDLCKKLMELLTKAKLKFNLPRGSITGKQLLGLLEPFLSDGISYYRLNQLIQFVIGIIQCLEQSEEKKNWSQLLSIEKILFLCLDDKKQLLDQIKQVLNNPIPGKTNEFFSMKETLVLCMLVYSLIGEQEFGPEEDSLKVAILQKLLLQNSQDSVWLNFSLPSQLAEREIVVKIKENLDGFFNRLHKLGKCRSSLTDFRHIVKGGKVGSAYTPFIQQLLSHLFDESKKELVDLEHLPSQSITNIFSSGFGRLGWKAKPHPLDNSFFIIFVVGGITCSEIREVKEFAKSKGKIIIGGSSLASSDLVFKRFWNKNLV